MSTSGPRSFPNRNRKSNTGLNLCRDPIVVVILIEEIGNAIVVEVVIRVAQFLGELELQPRGEIVTVVVGVAPVRGAVAVGVVVLEAIEAVGILVHVQEPVAVLVTEGAIVVAVIAEVGRAIAIVVARAFVDVETPVVIGVQVQVVRNAVTVCVDGRLE